MRLLIFLILAGASLTTFAKIPPMYEEVAKEQKVPVTLFYALVLNESRSVVDSDGKRRVLPWPWTINHQGKGHYFQTKEQAVAHGKKLIASGDKLFDVGLGQVNWYHHGEKFISLESAFDPKTNLTVAAKFLREQYNRAECSTWELAIGCYHRPGQRSKDKIIAKTYSKRVITLWVAL
tara:strand:+ start:32993 stop:33526 length:534 start_codon:yes stop_codon:yes gene_type:complete